uniref:Uncharacterized protein n=1 Tax=Magallana gigas TaxID=29159 RepID=K1PWE0_MAGGI
MDEGNPALAHDELNFKHEPCCFGEEWNVKEGKCKGYLRMVTDVLQEDAAATECLVITNHAALEKNGM